MAYKFQLGSAILSGSVVAEGSGEFHTEISIGNAAMSEADLEKLDGITNGTIAANKAVVVDGNKDASEFRNLQAVQLSASSNIVIGAADINETDLEKIDGITNGTVAAAKAVVVDSNKDISSFRNVTATRFIGEHSGSVSGAVGQFGMINAGGGGISSQGNIEGQAGTFTTLSASSTLSVGGTVRLDGAADALLTANADSLYFFDATDNLMKKESCVDYAATLAGGNGIDASAGVLFLDLNELVATTVDVAADSIAVIDANASNSSRKESIADMAALQAGTGIDANSGVFSTSAAQTGITSLLATDIKIGEDDQTKIDFEDEDKINFYVNNVKDLVLEENVLAPGADSEVDLGKTGTRWKDLYVDSATVTNNVIIGGTLTVNGSTTTINSTTIEISSSFTFEGPQDAHETILNCGTPVADTEVFLPTLAAGQYHLAALADAPTAASSAVTAAELAILDGHTAASSFTIADADQMIINDGGNGGTLVQATMLSLKTYMASEGVAKKVAGQTLAIGINYFDDFSADGEDAVTLPASSDMVVGQRIKVKAPSDCSATRYLVINTQATAQKIDGVDSIKLESPHAAVELVYVESNHFKVF